jgi:MFS family permease
MRTAKAAFVAHQVDSDNETALPEVMIDDFLLSACIIRSRLLVSGHAIKNSFWQNELDRASGIDSARTAERRHRVFRPEAGLASWAPGDPPRPDPPVRICADLSLLIPCSYQPVRTNPYKSAHGSIAYRPCDAWRTPTAARDDGYNAVSMPAPVSLFQQRSFVLFWLARVSASLALQMQSLAVGWQIYDLTRSAFDLGLVGLMQFLPLVSLLLIAGHAVDRYNRQMLVEASLAINGLSIATLAVATAGGFVSRELILAVILVFGCARAFQVPATTALLPAVVPAELLARAVAASASSMQIAIIAGPAIGGVLYAVSPTLVYGLSAALFLFASVLVWRIKLTREPPRREPLTFELAFAGILYIWRNGVILGAITLDLFAVLFGGATSLLPIFARDIFEVGPEGLGVLQLSPAVGALAISIPLSRWPMRGRIGPVLFATVAGFGCATIVFGPLPLVPAHRAGAHGLWGDRHGQRGDPRHPHSGGNT